jgi:hypothetical protein
MARTAATTERCHKLSRKYKAKDQIALDEFRKKG